jgi:peptide-methionine (R)-S-oxide reductase
MVVAGAVALGAAERSGGGAMGETIEVYSVEAGELVAAEVVTRSDEQWEQELSPEQYQVTREHGTERAFSGDYWNTKTDGLYRCVACGNDLFLSTTKFDSGTGWPSFSEPVHEANVGTRVDRTLWMKRTEVHCSRCGAHLGHVFPDGPPPTGQRYCVNSVSLVFVPAPTETSAGGR